jgi:hypothetical protein
LITRGRAPRGPAEDRGREERLGEDRVHRFGLDRGVDGRELRGGTAR